MTGISRWLKSMQRGRQTFRKPVLVVAVLLVVGLHLAAEYRTQLFGERTPTAARMPSPPGTSMGPGTAFQVYTDRGRPILVRSYPEYKATPKELADEERWLCQSGLIRDLRRTAPPTPTYVCHDWIFTGGSCTMAGGSVEMILEDNGYQEVAIPREGDLAVYREAGAGAIMHTGVVHAVDGSTILVESKWAWMGRYVHPSNVYCHPSFTCSFYRSSRTGHHLRGIDRGEPPAKSVPLLAEPKA